MSANFPIIAVVTLLIYLLLSWFTIFYFKARVPKIEIFTQKRKEFLSYYFNYVVCTSIIWGIVTISNFVVAFNCLYIHNPLLNIFVTIGNAAKIFSPVVLSCLRYRDPTIKKKVDYLYKKFCLCFSCCYFNNNSNERETILNKYINIYIYKYS